jgi:hypothetical protein
MKNEMEFDWTSQLPKKLPGLNLLNNVHEIKIIKSTPIKCYCESSDLQLTKASSGSVGWDLRAKENYTIHVGETTYVGTGIFLEIPEGFVGKIYSRSGLSTKFGVTLVNGCGIVDCFAKDSLISTIKGDMYVSQLKLHDVVYSINEDTLELEKDVITAIVDVGYKEVITLELENNKTVSLTPTTLIYTKEGLKYVKDLTINDEIIFGPQ